MNILILGSGGREYTFAWKLQQSPLCNQLYISPGNAGTSQFGINLDIQVGDFDSIAAIIAEKNIELVVIGPEVPLVDGIFDFLHSKHPTLKIIGPSAKAAQLEGSKLFAKEFMQRNHIPTAGYFEATEENILEAIDYLRQQRLPIVLKADGLAAGKGVLIIDNYQEAEIALEKMLQGQFGQASKIVVIEEFLDGIEFSAFVLTDGTSYLSLPCAKDYKRIGESDTGLNTGGMGAISPVPFVDEILWNQVEEKIIKPTIEGLNRENMDYRGFIFFGLINVNNEPYVIEYNCRMGDPETEVVLPRIQEDLLPLLIHAYDKTLPQRELAINPKFATTVMAVSAGYPGSYAKGKIIKGLEDVDRDCLIIHAGTKKQNEQVLTNGGRVLAVTAVANTMSQALANSYRKLSHISFEGMYYRRDIGFDL